MYILEAYQGLKDSEGNVGEVLKKLPFGAMFSVGRGTLSFFEVKKKIVLVFQLFDRNHDDAISSAELEENAEQLAEEINRMLAWR